MKSPQERFKEDFEKKASRGELDIEEYVSEGDCTALRRIAESISYNRRQHPLRIVEVGSWKGKSTSILGEIAKVRSGKVFAVDHWKGNVGAWNKIIAGEYDVFAIFRNNIKLLGLESVVCPLVMNSEDATSLFPDESLDLVFLDADHRYEYFKQDIQLWLPKVKNGGVICGHDCEKYYVKCSDELRILIDERIEDDVISGVCHPGVVKAVYEYFDGHYRIAEGSRVWYYRK